MTVGTGTWIRVLTLVLCAGSAYGQLSSADIAALRAKGELEGWTFTVGENEVTRRPLSELCGSVEPPDWRSTGPADPCLPERDLPESFDWRDYNGCTPIRNQGDCGSCWAFAAIGAVESGILIGQGIATNLSEQWLVSCTGAGSCSGGWHTEAFDYLRRNGQRDSCGDFGAVLESGFPYVAYNADCGCPYPHPYSIDAWAFVSSPGAVPHPNQIKQAMLDHGPVAVTVYVNTAFLAYKGGIFNACEDQQNNHAVVLVGWDDHQGAYGVWIMRNSWGPGWGEEGYMRIAYGCSGLGYAAAYVDAPQDCNHNGQFDDCDLDCQAGNCVSPCGQSSDCNLNGVPDECEPDEDCNGNGAQDICDVAGGTSADCNGNNVPDECEPDCDDSGVPDDCEVDEDCNNNGIQDICELAAGTCADCNENRRPDDCELEGFTSASGKLSPIGTGSPQQHTILAAPRALSDVTLSFTAIADLNLTLSEWVDVDINGVDVGRIFQFGNDCPSVPDSDELLVSAETFNAAVDGAEAVVNMIASNSVYSGQCVPYSFITVTVEYETALDVLPLGGDGIPDECQSDCNENGVPDQTDVVSSISSSSPPLSPIGAGSPQSHTFTSPPEAATNVVLTFTASADISGGVGESMDVFLNGVDIGNVFSGDAGDCSEPPDVDELVIEADTFNAAAAGGDAVIDMITTPWVDPLACDFPTYITVALAYGVPGTSLDCNFTGLPDECEAGDFDGDGMIQLSDAGPSAACVTGPCGAPPCDPPLYGDPCCILADFDHDGDTDLSDFAAFQTWLTDSM